MTTADAATTEAPITRSETRVPGGVVITVVTLKGPRYRARNLMGIVLRDELSVIEWASFADAEAALRRFAAGEAPPPRKVQRCPHCRGNHAEDACQVHAEAERRRDERRAALVAKKGRNPSPEDLRREVGRFVATTFRTRPGARRSAHVTDFQT